MQATDPWGDQRAQRPLPQPMSNPSAFGGKSPHGNRTKYSSKIFCASEADMAV